AVRISPLRDAILSRSSKDCAHGLSGLAAPARAECIHWRVLADCGAGLRLPSGWADDGAATCTQPIVRCRGRWWSVCRLLTVVEVLIRMVVYNQRDRHDGRADARAPGGAARSSERVSSAEVYQQLRQLILGGVYRPGERLVEENVAQRLGVSRTPVRQALTMLEAEGLVEIVRHRGATVCAFGIDDVWNLYDLRAVLEAHA